MLVVSGVSAFVIRYTRVVVVDRAQVLSARVAAHVGIGGVLFLICLGTWWTTSGKYLRVRTRTKSG